MALRILSIDGGGIRGIIPAMVLTEIEAATDAPISSLFDVIAGTSTGGIIALGLAKPSDDGTPEYSSAELVDLYASRGERIFHRSWYRRLRPLGRLAAAKYSSAGLEHTLGEFFGETMLSEALTHVVVPSYDIEKRLPIYFTTYFARGRPGFDHQMRKVAQATASAPTYFPPLRMRTTSDVGHLSLVDGGVYANNPTLAAFAEARGNLEFDLDDLVVVSLGTGKVAESIALDRAKGWGLVGWSTRILDVVMESVSESVHRETLYLLRGTRAQANYHRLQPGLDKSERRLDDATPANIERLRVVAGDLVRSERAQIDRICEALT